MELKTIRQASLDYGVSRRMLCYYEEIGLIKSSRKDDYAYRVYDENVIQRLQQIIILCKLQIPVKQIKDILNNPNAVEVIEIFKQNISQLDEEITALSTLKSILMGFVDELQEKAGDMITQFVKESRLLKIKPDARSFGFDCSKGAAVLGEPSHVYEMWVSIPDDIEIPAPLVKRTFDGGLYAAHVLRTWDFQDWRLLKEWVNASDKYDNDWDSPRWTSLETVAGQGFEETLNFYNFVQKGGKMEDLQLDLLFPIKEKG